MRKVIVAIAAVLGAATLSLSSADQAAAASAPNFSKVPNLETLIGPRTEAVAYLLYHKYHHGCYRPYYCKSKYGYHYKHCYWGHCKYYKKRYYKPHHHYKKHYYKKKHH